MAYMYETSERKLWLIAALQTEESQSWHPNTYQKSDRQVGPPKLAQSELQAEAESGSQRQFAVKAAYHISTLPDIQTSRLADLQAFERRQKDPNVAKRAAGEPLAIATFASCFGHN